MMVMNLKSVPRMVLFGLLLGGLSGCGYDRYLPEEGRRAPKSISVKQAQLQTISAPQITRNPSLYYQDLSYRFVTVLPGDTITKIANRHNVPVKSIVALNNSRPPFVIRVGQQVKIPHFKMHRVQVGETLYAISRVYEVEMGEVVHFNQLATPYILSQGMTLKIPQPGANEIRVASVGKTGWAVSEVARERPISARNSGSTISNLSGKSIEIEPLSAPQPVRRGAQPEIKTKQKPINVATLPPTETVEPVGVSISVVDLPPLPRHRYSIKQPPIRSGKIFNWPAKGPVVSAFGKKDTGFHNDGINIKLKSGTLIRAAENGVVSYVGNEMRSFGNLILISHADGYVTTYGHVDQTNVRKGETVRKGDVIATAGATGDVTTAQLHFEIRKNGTAKNPMRLLGRR